MNKIIRTLLTMFFSALLLYSGYKIYSTYAEYNETEKIHNDIINQVVSLRNYNIKEDMRTNEQSYTPDQRNDDAQMVAEIVPISVDFDKLCELNPDVIGWIYCEDTVINYPIVQGDNNTYYLDHLFNGQPGKSGTLFVDNGCSSDFSDKNTLIYGHHMKDGSMLASIVDYQSQEYYDAHPVMYLLTPTEKYTVKIFSAYITDSNSESFSIWFDSASEYEGYLTTIAKKSNFRSKVTATSKDKLITLSTCTYEYTNARYVVHAIITTL